jgi:hypothetical protein
VSGARAIGAAALALGALVAAGPAAAAGRWLGVAALGGTAQPVAALADYQWDVRPHAAWGAQLAAGTGPFTLGLRHWRARTTQALGLAGASDPAVRTTSFELLARARVTAWRGVGLEALASGGRLALRYEPDHVTVDVGGTPVEVGLGPVDGWVAGAGLALRAALPGRWGVGLEAERRVYALDTAHRSGTAIVYGRDRFGDWSTRLALERAWDW